MVNKVVLLFVFLLTMAGCANTNFNYELGDFSSAYCGSTNQEFRAAIKAKLNSNGVKVGVDYCAVHGFVDMVVN